MKRLAAVLLALICLALSGCGSWMDGHYVSETPHMERSDDDGQDLEWISNKEQLYDAICSMVNYGTSSDVFFMRDYTQKSVEDDMLRVVYQIMYTDPIGAYAVENIEYELGVNGGQSTLAVNVEYNHQRAEILRIKKVRDMDAAKSAVVTALNQMSTKLVLYVNDYEAVDFAQIVEDYALKKPEMVIEVPQVSITVYPEKGNDRVVEMNFIYQTNRDSLRNMQSQIKRMFESAELYVSSDESTYEKLSHLYVFLMERNNYQIGTSITPAYSLLRYGVGNAKSFAVVFAAMCQRIGVECQVVSGTRDGESWFWNIVKEDDAYCHVDLLRCAQNGEFRERSDAQMEGYVWDYSAYPPCDREVPAEPIPEETTQWTEETEPESTEAETTEPTEMTEQGG